MKAFAQLVVEKLSWIDQVLSYVWLGLFGLMLLAIFIIYAKIGWSRAINLLLIIIVSTFSYPIYTFGFKLIPALIGNILYMLLVAYTLNVLWTGFPMLVYMLCPIIIWVMTASVYVSAQLLVKYL